MRCNKCGHVITPFRDRLGNRKKKIRVLRKRGFSYREIASLTGVSLQTVQLALGWKRKPREDSKDG